MTYLKTFAMFESELANDSLEQINENMQEMAKALPADIKKAIKKMNPEEAGEAAKELAKKLKLKVADLTNTEKVVAAMAKMTAVTESEVSEDEDELNEGLANWIKVLKAKKAKIGEFMQKAGLGTLAGGVLVTALNAPDQYIPSNVTVEPNLWATFGMAAIAVGFIAAVAGAKAQGTLASDAAAASSAIHR